MLEGLKTFAWGLLGFAILLIVFQFCYSGMLGFMPGHRDLAALVTYVGFTIGIVLFAWKESQNPKV